MHTTKPQTLLGGSWGLVSKAIDTLIGLKVMISIATLTVTVVTKSDDPLSNSSKPKQSPCSFDL